MRTYQVRGRLGLPAPYARGIFLTYTCEDCHDRKMAQFRPDVLTDPSYWTDEPMRGLAECD